MKILVVSQYFYPEAFRINDIVKELVKRSHNVTVLTGLPNYPEGKIYEGYENSYSKIEDYYGASVYRCKLRPRKKGALNLAFNYFSFVKQAKKTLARIKPEFDVIYFYGLSPISSGIPAVWFGKRHNIPTVIYNLDIWPDSVRDSRGGKTMSKANPIFLISKALSKHVYKRFDLILNKCDEFGHYLMHELRISKKMLTVYEHAEDLYLSVEETPLDNGYIDFVFLGNIGKIQNCNQMIESFSMLDDKRARLHFVGEGSYLEELKKTADRLRLNERVIFHGRCSLEETIGFYNLADVCLLALSCKTASGLTPPAKLPGYMASCRPVVASINGAAAKIINDSHCGFVCDADDVVAFSKIMKLAIENVDNLITLGKNGRAFFLDNFTLMKHVDKLEEALYSLTNGLNH